MGKGIEVIGKVEEAWIPSSVFGSDTRSAGCADGGSTVGAVIIDGRHEDGAARDDVSNANNGCLAVLTGVDYVWSFGIVKDHTADFSAGGNADYVADGDVGVAEWG